MHERRMNQNEGAFIQAFEDKQNKQMFAAKTRRPPDNQTKSRQVEASVAAICQGFTSSNDEQREQPNPDHMRFEVTSAWALFNRRTCVQSLIFRNHRQGWARCPQVRGNRPCELISSLGPESDWSLNLNDVEPGTSSAARCPRETIGRSWTPYGEGSSVPTQGMLSAARKPLAGFCFE